MQSSRVDGVLYVPGKSGETKSISGTLSTARDGTTRLVLRTDAATGVKYTRRGIYYLKHPLRLNDRRIITLVWKGGKFTGRDSAFVGYSLD